MGWPGYKAEQVHTFTARQCAGQNPCNRGNLGVGPSFEDKGSMYMYIHVPIQCMYCKCSNYSATLI